MNRICRAGPSFEGMLVYCAVTNEIQDVSQRDNLPCVYNRIAGSTRCAAPTHPCFEATTALIESLGNRNNTLSPSWITVNLRRNTSSIGRSGAEGSDRS